VPFGRWSVKIDLAILERVSLSAHDVVGFQVLEKLIASWGLAWAYRFLALTTLVIGMASRGVYFRRGTSVLMSNS
jgi:hypothetical protein